jgi:hypothetical protein
MTSEMNFKGRVYRKGRERKRESLQAKETT